MTRSVETHAVAEGEAGIRLDRWFKRRFPELGHGRLEKLLRTGQVRVDGGRAKAGMRLAAGQTIRVPPFAETRPEKTPARPVIAKADADRLRDAVLHRDDAVLVIDKPPGLAVQGGTRTVRHLDAMLDALRFGAPDRPRLVHRLDKDTSGVLALARSPAAAAALTAAFRAKTVRKIYWAAVVGVPRHHEGRIDLPLAKTRGGGGERVRSGGEGKRALTYYRIVDAAAKTAAWLALEPKTGRTHQLRVHCAGMGTPIFGDGKYGGRAAFIDGAPEIAKALHLHARAIRLPHPDGGVVEAAAPLPPHMLATWRFLGFDEDTGDGDFDVFPD